MVAVKRGKANFFGHLTGLRQSGIFMYIATSSLSTQETEMCDIELNYYCITAAGV